MEGQKKTKIAPWLHGMDNTYALNKVHASFWGGGGRGESFLLPKVGTWGFLCAEQHGLAGW